MNWKTKRVKDKLAQSIYFYEHPYCEVCLAEGRGKRLREVQLELIK